MKKVALLFGFLYAFCPAWSQQKDSLAQPKPDTTQISYTENTIDSFKVVGAPVTGKAGMYSSRADGSITANGERFDNSLFTAASNKYPLNTWVKVTNLKNRHWVLLRINDRTSRKPGAAIIEISRAGVAKLGFLRTGFAKVKIEKINVNNYKSIDNGNLSKSLPSKDTLALLTKITVDSFRLTGKSIKGLASFYSSNLDGTLTATGERYRNKKLTAASNNFPLNTWVLVTNLRNNKSVIVRINDRMHPRMKKKGRVVDMSGSAASVLDMKDAGVVKVKVEVLQEIKSSDIVKDTLLAMTDSLQTRDSIIQDIVPANTTQSVVQKASNEDSIGVLAGIYNAKLDGATTSTGEKYRNKKLSAASNDFPLRSRVRVTNLKNNQTLVVRINDRIHPKMKAGGAVIVLSRLAAQKLGFLKSGNILVTVVPEPKMTLN